MWQTIHWSGAQFSQEVSDSLFLVLCGRRPIFPVEKRIELIRKITEDLNQRIEVVQVDGLLADFIAEENIDF